ncbi:hypothetical protein [Leptospira santarosai]|uniref:Uncharacterized protein n=1 Tax=Leptospira santarosai str. ZUN179 TaxID=1049985 RepID=M6UQ48_9LEPT|nr:hypothetical protein [Leptospira santarosai]EMO47267.1 hypothetical protein LEP1GSC187_0007 [Leptospira santarosai str. ZUN179]
MQNNKIKFVFACLLLLTTSIVPQQSIEEKQYSLQQEKKSESAEVKERLIKIQYNIKKLAKEKNENSFWLSLLPIFIAFLAGFLALLQIKKNAVTNARITYTQDLRKIISEFSAHYSHLERSIALHGQNRLSISEQAELRKDVRQLQVLSYHIFLSLDPVRNETHKRLEENTLKILNLLEKGKNQIIIAEFLELDREFLLSARSFLKESWKEAKALWK